MLRNHTHAAYVGFVVTGLYVDHFKDKSPGTVTQIYRIAQILILV